MIHKERFNTDDQKYICLSNGDKALHIVKKDGEIWIYETILDIYRGYLNDIKVNYFKEREEALNKLEKGKVYTIKDAKKLLYADLEAVRKFMGDKHLSRYSDSFDSVMPVIAKINELSEEINHNAQDDIYKHLLTGDLEKTFLAVVVAVRDYQKGKSN